MFDDLHTRAPKVECDVKVCAIAVHGRRYGCTQKRMYTVHVRRLCDMNTLDNLPPITEAGNQVIKFCVR